MQHPARSRFATRSAVLGTRGMVATSHPLATAAGLDALKRGGTAADAAIAANAMLGLVEPTGCGIGGDLFAIVREPAGGLAGLNASGRSPRGLTREHFERLGLRRIPTSGPLSVSVPGAVDGWFELHARYGRLPMGELLAPAIDYGRHGFPVTAVIAEAWAAEAARLGGHPGFGEVFLPGGAAPREGDTFVNARLAAAYELLAAGGRDAFYRGPIADAIERRVRAGGGFLAADDCARHRSEWVEPVSTDYRGCTVWELPPNGQGVVVLQMLNILEGFDLRALGFGSAQHLHLLVEAKKLAFEDRARYYADPAFADVPVEGLLSKAYAEERRRLIDLERAAAPTHGEPPGSRRGDTVYLAAADGDGRMVSLIQSNYRGFGSGVTVTEFGFVLQNRGESFSLSPGHPNSYEPGKRPFHTIIPAFAARDGEWLMSFGVMGAAMQPQGQVQVLTNMIDFGMGVQEAGDAPRVRHEGSSEPTGAERAPGGGVVYVEPGFAAEAIEGLRERGHVVERAGGAAFGGYQAVLRDLRRGVYFGASESRKDGHAAGF
ncbi:MAG TPA: gamma-glutamyltransferase [Gammaproteobacteria bacterium]